MSKVIRNVTCFAREGISPVTADNNELRLRNSYCVFVAHLFVCLSKLRHVIPIYTGK